MTHGLGQEWGLLCVPQDHNCIWREDKTVRPEFRDHNSFMKGVALRHEARQTKNLRPWLLPASGHCCSLCGPQFVHL